MNLAIIPARGGSKRIPRKNIKPFCGKPMLAWSIEAAHASKCFDRIIVSTDDEEIAKVAKSYGAEVPFMRPPELSDDHAGTRSVVQHAIEEMTKPGANFDYVCCIYATAALLEPKRIQESLNSFRNADADFCMSVVEFGFPIHRALGIAEGQIISPFFPESMSMRSQDLPRAFHDAAQFIWGTATAFLSDQKISQSNSIGYVVSRISCQDIDTPEDWELAELKFDYLKRPTHGA